MYKLTLRFATAGSIMTIVFLAIVNLITGIEHLWFIYPAFFIMWWPISTYYIMKRKAKRLSVIGFILFSLFFASINYIFTPSHPWCLYIIYVLIWWPIIMHTGKKVGTLPFSIVGCVCTIVYYTILNILIAPNYPWAIFPGFAILWWPVTLCFVRKRQFFTYSVVGSIIIAVFFITVNVTFTPNTIWALYPIFAAAWWPLSTYYFVHSRGKMLKKVKLLFLNNYRK